jgi:hypothetical protein
MSTTLMKTSEILIAGLELLGPEGEHWTQGAYKSLNSFGVCYCGVGCVQQAAFGNVYTASDPRNKASKYWDARKIIGQVQHEYISWQDDRSRTFPEVKEVFLIAIKMAQEAEQLGEA